MLKPYYIKADTEHIRVVLAYQYFSILIKDQLYHFVPIEAKEIKINRKTKKIVNVDVRFSFQKGKEIIYLKMTDLIALPDFLIQLYFIVESYYAQDKMASENKPTSESTAVVKELERLNIIRSIDKALDARDEEAFYTLTRLL